MPTFLDPGLLSFTATIRRNDGGGAFVAFPFDMFATFGVQGRVPILATFDDIDYRGSLVRMGGPHHLILILKDIRQRLGKDRGDQVRVTVRLDDTPRQVEVPDDLARALASASKTAAFGQLAYSKQREAVIRITSAKQPATRSRRIQATIDELAPVTTGPTDD